MTPERLSAYVTIFTRDLLPPMVGTFLAIYLPMSGAFEAWQLPLIAGLFGVPLVAPRKGTGGADGTGAASASSGNGGGT